MLQSKDLLFWVQIHLVGEDQEAEELLWLGLLALQALLGHERCLVEHIPAICAGPVTAAAVREAGLPVALVSTHPGSPAMVEAVADYWLSRGSALASMNLARDDAQNSERIAGR